MKFNSLTIWNIGLPLQHCDLHSCRNISAFQFESVHPGQASELKESLKWYHNVANGWVTGDFIALSREDKMAFRDRNRSSGSDGVYGVENEGEDNFEDEPSLRRKKR